MNDIPDPKPDDQQNAPKRSPLDSKAFQMALGLGMAVVLIGGIVLLRMFLGVR